MPPGLPDRPLAGSEALAGWRADGAHRAPGDTT